MGKQHIYTIWAMKEPTAFRVSKFDMDYNAIEQYYVNELPGNHGAMVCSCPAKTRHTCRHREMLRIFQAEDRISSGMFYNYDTKKWYPAISGDEV